MCIVERLEGEIPNHHKKINYWYQYAIVIACVCRGLLRQRLDEIFSSYLYLVNRFIKFPFIAV